MGDLLVGVPGTSPISHINCTSQCFTKWTVSQSPIKVGLTWVLGMQVSGASGAGKARCKAACVGVPKVPGGVQRSRRSQRVPLHVRRRARPGLRPLAAAAHLWRPLPPAAAARLRPLLPPPLPPRRLPALRCQGSLPLPLSPSSSCSFSWVHPARRVCVVPLRAVGVGASLSRAEQFRA